MESLNESMQRTRANLLIPFRFEFLWWLAPVADLVGRQMGRQETQRTVAKS